MIPNSLILPCNSVVPVPRFFTHFCFWTFFNSYSLPSTEIFDSTEISMLSIIFPFASNGRISKSELPRLSFPNNSHVNASNMVVFPVAFAPEILVFSPNSIVLSLHPLKFWICMDSNLTFLISTDYIPFLLIYNLDYTLARMLLNNV